ncbi:TauD/TfdA family dioxygenase [Bdellovibrio sp. HCB337]|uniref:TauD/TfdA family dioxygenase n=1 Tax=Bdellovibrio sp. HCB337 TaxID=3394358 RepID=UPI0039A4A887
MKIIDGGGDGLSAQSSEAFFESLKERSETLHADLIKHGAILLRGFPIDTPEKFGEVTRILAGEAGLLTYEGGISPRSEVAAKVFTATNAPNYMKISMHSEMVYLKEFPSQILFYCDVEPQIGGETPIADTRAVLNSVSPAVRKKIEERGVLYVRELSPLTPMKRWLEKLNSIFGMSTWQRSYGTESREQVEESCKHLGQEYTWKENGAVETRIRLPATLVHPVTKDTVWFNNVHYYLIHARNFGPFFVHVIRLYKKIFREVFDAFYGDGSIISDEDKIDISNAIDQNTKSFRWKKGDVLILDNLLMMHGRNPFKGPRRILVSMIGRSTR